MSSGTSAFILVVTVANLLGCLWLIWWTSRRRPDEQKTTGHVWDGDLEELNNPLPRWWLWVFVITVIFAFVYLVLYPGYGEFASARDWSSRSQYEAEVARIDAEVAAHFAPFADLAVAQLAQNEAAMAAARNLFGHNCSTCHGSDARGARGFPSLTDDDWLWDNDPDTVVETIAQGRIGVMPALGDALGRQNVEHVVAYVMSLSGRKAPADWIAAGKMQFEAVCSACHGVDGRGNPLLGAPDLTDEIWLHGGSAVAIRATIMRGRSSEMPAHLDLLGETRVRLLAAYVLRLSGSATGQESSARTGQRESGVSENAGGG